MKIEKTVLFMILGVAVLARFPLSATGEDRLAFMPPHPDLPAKLKEKGLPWPMFLTDPVLRSRGLDNPPGTPKQMSGTIKTLAVLVQFSDNTASATATFFDNLIFAQPPANSVRDYFDQISSVPWTSLL